MPESFCRTLGMHCFCSYSVNSESSVSFLRQNFSHMPTVHLARCSQPLPLVRSTTRALGAFLVSVAPWPACAGVLCGGRTPITPDRGTTPRQNAVRRRPNPLRAPHGHLLASARMQHRRRGAARAERAPCRRRARAASFRRAPPKPPYPDALSTKMESVDPHDGAQPLNHPDQCPAPP